VCVGGLLSYLSSLSLDLVTQLSTYGVRVATSLASPSPGVKEAIAVSTQTKAVFRAPLAEVMKIEKQGQCVVCGKLTHFADRFSNRWVCSRECLAAWLLRETEFGELHGRFLHDPVPVVHPRRYWRQIPASRAGRAELKAGMEWLRAHEMAPEQVERKDLLRRLVRALKPLTEEERLQLRASCRYRGHAVTTVFMDNQDVPVLLGQLISASA